MKSIFTTGEAADICRVSQQTIIRCFDSGRLKGFKVPGSKFRRIPRAALLCFMKEHDIPTEAMSSAKPKVLIIGRDCPAVIEGEEAYEAKLAQSVYEAGLLTRDFQPDVILLGTMEHPTEQAAICSAIRQDPDLQHIRVVICGSTNGSPASELLHAGASLVADASSSIEDILRRLQPKREVAEMA